MSDLGQISFYAAVPVAAMMTGGVIAAFYPPGKRLSSGIQHFAAGVVFAVVAAELLPEVRRQHASVEMAVSFSLGVALMLTLRILAKRLESRKRKGGSLPWGLITAVGLDVLIDGLLLGVGSAVGGGVGFLLTIALGVELMSLGLAMAAQIAKESGRNKGRNIAVICGIAAVFAAGAVVGGLLLQGISMEWLGMMLSFGCAAFLYLVTEELLVEAHQGAESPVIAAIFFVGFLAIFLLDMVNGSS